MRPVHVPAPLRPISSRRRASLAATFVFALAAGLGTGAAQAQKVKPGLWENAVTMKSSDGRVEAAMAQMRERMASMPPEQRAQMEAMMARQGIGVGGAGKPNTVRSCISPEMAARDEFNPGDGRCKSTGHSRTGKTVRFKFSCTGEDGRSSGQGEGEFTLVSDTQTQGKMWVDTQRDGKTMRMEMESSSRWLGADCGTLKPVR